MATGLFNDLMDNDGGGTTLACATVTNTTTGTGSAVDMIGTEGLVNALLTVGAVSGSAPSLTFQVQESTATNTGFANVADSRAAFAAVTDTSNARQWIFFYRTKRYLKIVPTSVGTITSVTANVEFVARKKISGTGAGVQL